MGWIIFLATGVLGRAGLAVGLAMGLVGSWLLLGTWLGTSC